MPLPAQSLAGATIAFDLDGTLVDTAPDLVGAVNVLLEQHSLPTLPFELARVMIGRGAYGRPWLAAASFFRSLQMNTSMILSSGSSMPP